jgi:hypothetical protein
LATVEREATEVIARAKSAEWLKRQEEVRDREWALHKRAVAAAEKAIDAFLSREKVYANLSDISRVLEVISKLGRLSTGLATDRTEMTVEGDVTVRVELEAALKKVYGPQAGGGHVVDAEVVTDALPEPRANGKPQTEP